METPPLQALRALDAAARHLSYSRAAEELSLTHGAVSHHITKLEALLGTRLFIRDGHRMVLTNDGQILAARIRQGLAVIVDAFDEFERRSRTDSGGRRTVTVSVLPSFAARWLLPRLADFSRLHPDIDIALRPTAELARLDGRDGVDLAIRYGQGRWGHTKSQFLMPGQVFPVASPTYLLTHPIKSPADLHDATLLRKPGQPWRPWFASAGLDWEEPVFGPSYDDAGLVLDAAAQGQGVALARAALVEGDLVSGRLVRVTDFAINDVYAWFLVSRTGANAIAGAVHAFETWLIDATMSADATRMRSTL